MEIEERQALPTYRVLLYDGLSSRPSLQLVTASNHLAAEETADQLLREATGGIGVEVWRDQRRIYSRGAVPAKRAY